MTVRKIRVAAALLGLTACDGAQTLVGGAEDAAAGGRAAPARDASTPESDGLGATDLGVSPTPDAGLEPGADAGPTPSVCPERTVLPADADRIVLVGHRFTDAPERRGTEVRALTLRGFDTTLLDNGQRLDVGEAPGRIVFAHHGLFAFVLGEDGLLSSVLVSAPTALEVLDQVQLPSAGYGDLRVSDDDSRVFVAGSNVTNEAGLSRVDVDCEGRLTLVDKAHFGVRLAESLDFVPGRPDRAVLLGGQAVFDPVDPLDVRLLSYGENGFSLVEAFDVYGDMVSAGRIGVSGDGALVLVPNDSPFSEEGGQLAVLALEGDTLTELDRIVDLPDAREIEVSSDGRTALLSQIEPGIVRAFALSPDGVEAGDMVRGVGLADQMARVRRGPMTDVVVVSAVSPVDGSQVQVLRIGTPGHVTRLGVTPLGGGSSNIPGAIGIQP